MKVRTEQEVGSESEQLLYSLLLKPLSTNLTTVQYHDITVSLSLRILEANVMSGTHKTAFPSNNKL